MNSSGVLTVPGTTWGPGAGITNWPVCTGYGIASAASAGVALQVWDHMRVCATNSNTSVTMADTTGIVAGMNIYGVNIPSSTTVSSVTNGTTIVISQSATGTGTGINLCFSFDLTAGSSQVVFPSVSAFFKNPGE
jgi:hypothetical protein